MHSAKPFGAPCRPILKWGREIFVGNIYSVIAITTKSCHCLCVRCIQRFPRCRFPEGVTLGSSFEKVNGRFELYHGTLVNPDGSYSCRLYGGELFYRKKPLSPEQIQALLNVAERTPDPTLIGLINQVILDSYTPPNYAVPQIYWRVWSTVYAKP